jgi:nucleoside-diphosphate-sugar epimerase
LHQCNAVPQIHKWRCALARPILVFEENVAMPNTELHVVLGAGQVGPLVAEMLVARGHRVRVARRTAAPSRTPGVETVAIDVRDADAVARAAEGAAVVYHCANPLYHEWPEKLLPMTRGIVDGAARAGARLVVLDNLYMYGDTSNIDEETPTSPVSKKGALRVQAADYMLDADARGALRVSIGRGADFFGPEGRLSMLGDHFFQRVLSGKSAQVFGDPDLPRAYSYIPDIAAGLVALGSRADARGVWMLPIQPAETTRQVIGRFASALGRDIPVARLPTWLMRGVGLFQPLVREVAEMAYQWEQPYRVDDARFRAAFGVMPTPWDEAIARTVAWANEAYAGGQPKRTIKTFQAVA